MQPVSMQAAHLDTVACLHAEALAGDFLPSLGVHFLRAFYHAALRSGAAFGFVAQEAGQTAGFILGTPDMSRLFRRVLLTEPFSLAQNAVPALLRSPGMIRMAFEALFYPKKEAIPGISAELVVIAVAPELQGRRIGHSLVETLNTAFRTQGIECYKVTVLQSNQGANRFYQRMGFHLAGQFDLYHRAWNVYTISLEAISR